MEHDAISANVSRGGLKSTAEIKILVLYLLMHVDEPVPSNQVSDLLHVEGIANTFEVNDAFHQLSNNGLIDAIDEEGTAFIINAKGCDAAQTLQSTVPFTVREKSLKLLKKMLKRNRNIRETDIKIERNGNGVYITCSALEKDKTVMSFSLQATDYDQAFRIKENFLDDPSAVYRVLVDILTK